jgi:hypothetical protein
VDSLTGGGGAQLVLAGGTQTHFPTEAKYTDEFVELLGWVVTEGTLYQGRKGAGFSLSQSVKIHPDHVSRIRRLARWTTQQGFPEVREYVRADGLVSWNFGADVGREVRAVLGPQKEPLPEFLTALTFNQATLLYNTLLDGDGDTQRAHGEYFWQNNWAVMDAFQMLAMMLGRRSTARATVRDHAGRYPEGKLAGTVSVYQSRHSSIKDMQRTQEHYTGKVWCPTTSTGTWIARRKEVMQDGSGRKVIYLTGNCFP